MIKMIKISDEIGRKLDNVITELRKLPEQAHKVFFDNTPRRTGNARSKTRLRGDTIMADYPYAVRLDNGWSKQKPQGMSRPTKQFIRNRLSRIGK